MLRLILSNRWLAAIWALMTLISIASFVREGSPSMKALDDAAARMRAQRQQEATLKQASENAAQESDGQEPDEQLDPDLQREPAFGEGVDPNTPN